MPKKTLSPEIPIDLALTILWIRDVADGLCGHAVDIGGLRTWVVLLKKSQRKTKSVRHEFEKRKQELQDFPEQIADSISRVRESASGIGALLTASGYEMRVFDCLTKIENQLNRYYYPCLIWETFTDNNLQEDIYWLQQQAEELEGLAKDLARVGVQVLGTDGQTPDDGTPRADVGGERWSEATQLKIIAVRLGLSRESRQAAVKRRLKTLNSELKKIGRQAFRVRIDGMDDVYQDKFMPSG